MRLFLLAAMVSCLAACAEPGPSYELVDGSDETDQQFAGLPEAETGGGSGFTMDDATQGLSIAASALSIAGSLSGNGGGYGAPTPRGGSVGLPPSNGYSQVGAFRDCDATYRAAGRPDLAAECARRATNMGSLR